MKKKFNPQAYGKTFKKVYGVGWGEPGGADYVKYMKSPAGKKVQAISDAYDRKKGKKELAELRQSMAKYKSKK